MDVYVRLNPLLECDIPDKITPYIVSPEDLACFELEDEFTTLKIKKARRAVSFREREDVYELRSQPQHEVIWYQPHELLEIRKSTETTLRLLKCGKPLDESEHCVRGLAARTKVGAKKRRQARRVVRSGVVEEQRRQREDSKLDPDRIAQLCRAQSAASVRSAVILGKRDAERAREIYGERRYLK